MPAAHGLGHDEVDGLADGLLGGVPEEALAGGVPEGDPACLVGADDAVGRRAGDVHEA